MWEMILDRIPSTVALVYTVAAFLVPYGIYKLNNKLHQYGDPPWKEKE